MKRNTIRKKIQSKISDWIDSINDQKLKEEISENCIVTGGCITSMLLNETVNDYDVYFRDKKTAKLVVQYYMNMVNTKYNAGLELFDLDNHELMDEFSNINLNESDDLSNIRRVSLSNMDKDRIKIFHQSGGYKPKIEKNEDDEVIEKYIVKYVSPNAITLSDGIQIIFRFWGDPQTIHSNYDFVHTTNYFLFKKGELSLNEKALTSTITKELIYQGSKYPLTSIIRSRKFIQRGWSINAGQYLKMIYQCSKLDLDDFRVLEEQIIGVDVIYFGTLLDILRQKKAENPDFNLSMNWLFEQLDEIFSE